MATILPVFDNNGDNPMAQMQAMLAKQSQEMKQQMEAMEARLDKRLKNIEARLDATSRSANVILRTKHTELVPLKTKKNEDVNPFPRNIAAIEELSSDELNALLIQFGPETRSRSGPECECPEHSLEERRELLKGYFGIKLTLDSLYLG
ncbi:hypothetical protein RUND412_003561 [Rhizina undulata]